MGPVVLRASSGDGLPPTSRDDQATTSKLVYGLLSDSRYAYRPRPLDGTLSADIVERYLDSLAGSKMFFIAPDIARFAKFKEQDRKRVVQGQRGSVRVKRGGRRIITKKKQKDKYTQKRTEKR